MNNQTSVVWIILLGFQTLNSNAFEFFAESNGFFNMGRHVDIKFDQNSEVKRLNNIIEKLLGELTPVQTLLQVSDKLVSDTKLLIKSIEEQKEIEFIVIRKKLSQSLLMQDKTIQAIISTRAPHIQNSEILLTSINKLRQKLLTQDSSIQTTKEALIQFNIDQRLQAIDYSKIYQDYKDFLTKEISGEKKEVLKYLILEKANNNRPNSDMIFMSMLEILGYETSYIENSDFVRYYFELFGRSIEVSYKGYYVNGLREGWGKLSHMNYNVFYEGEFRKDYIFGKDIKLFHELGNLLLELANSDKKESDDQLLLERAYLSEKELLEEQDFRHLSLENSNGSVKIYHQNGQLDYKGELKNGLKNCEDGEEYYENGSLRYKGQFRENGYNGKDVCVFQPFLDIYQPLQTSNLLLKGNFKNGKLEGELTDSGDSRLYLVSPNSESLVWWASFSNGKFDTTNDKQKATILLNDPNIDCLYEGNYRNGLKHGYGYIQCRPNMVTVFDGEWRSNLPYRNKDSNGKNGYGNVIFRHRVNGNKVFEGTVNMGVDQWIYGYGSFYDAHGGTGMVMYEGNYRAPCLTALIFVTFDLELESFRQFVPAFS